MTTLRHGAERYRESRWRDEAKEVERLQAELYAVLPSEIAQALEIEAKLRV